MTGHQKNEVASGTAVKRDREPATPQSRQTAGQDSRIQDMLEDDDVREALRLLHAEKPAVDRPNRD